MRNIAVTVFLVSLVLCGPASGATLAPLDPYRAVRVLGESIVSQTLDDFDAHLSVLTGTADQTSSINDAGINAKIAVGTYAWGATASSHFGMNFTLTASAIVVLQGDGVGSFLGGEDTLGKIELGLWDMNPAGFVTLVSLTSVGELLQFNRTLSLEPGRYQIAATASAIHSAAVIEFTLRVVPEPSTLLLAALAGPGLVAMRVRSRR